MGTRSAELATPFEQANDECSTAVEAFSAVDWAMYCADDKRSVGVLAHHVAVSHAPVAHLIQASVAGQPAALTSEMIHQGNAQHAAEHAQCTKEETLALLRADGPQAAAVVRGLRDDQLTLPAPFTGTVKGLIEHILIHHSREHLATIRAVLAQ